MIYQRNYDAVVKRGLITENTTDFQFLNKLIEEIKEVEETLYGEPEKTNEEIADVIVVGINWLINRGCNVEEMLTKIAEKNEKRAK